MSNLFYPYYSSVFSLSSGLSGWPDSYFLHQQPLALCPLQLNKHLFSVIIQAIDEKSDKNIGQCRTVLWTSVESHCSFSCIRDATWCVRKSLGFYYLLQDFIWASLIFIVSQTLICVGITWESWQSADSDSVGLELGQDSVFLTRLQTVLVLLGHRLTLYRTEARGSPARCPGCPI